jgi:DNA-binding NarL/FixJ family response regulator
MDDLDGWQTAALLRGLRAAAALPIVFVSGNLFDHRPDRIEALRCQGFVAKPVLESELLDALERALQLEWVRADMPLAPVPPPVSADPVAHLLPEELREELLRLVHHANASALRQRLRSAQRQWPALAESLQVLQASADRFDFAALAAQLREDEDVARA